MDYSQAYYVPGLTKIPKEIPEIPKEIPEIPKEIPEIPKEIPEIPKEIPEIPKEIPEIPKEFPENTEYNTGSFPHPQHQSQTASIPDDFSFSQPQLTHSYNPLNQNITTDSLEIRTISSGHPQSQQKTQNDSQ
jgi:hypothetical protein